MAASGGLLARDFIGQHAHDVALFHDEVLDTVDLDLGARPLAEQHAVADLDVERDELAGLVAAAFADRDDLALGGLFLRGVGNDDAAGGLLLGVEALDDDAVVKRTELHAVLLSACLTVDLAGWPAARIPSGGRLVRHMGGMRKSRKRASENF